MELALTQADAVRQRRNRDSSANPAHYLADQPIRRLVEQRDRRLLQARRGMSSLPDPISQPSTATNRPQVREWHLLIEKLLSRYAEEAGRRPRREPDGRELDTRLGR